MNIRGIANVACISIGAWLLLSSLSLRHSPAFAANAGVIGLASIGLGLAARRGRDWCRWIAAALGVWLFFSTWLLPNGTAGIVVNYLLSATLLFGFASLPIGRGRASGANAV